MKSFKVLLHNFNTNSPEAYDIMPYLIRTWQKCEETDNWWPAKDYQTKPSTREDFIEFVKSACRNQYWSRCEYEFLMLGWPYGKTDTLEDCYKVIKSTTKIDAYAQIEMNLEVITDVFIENVKSL